MNDINLTSPVWCEMIFENKNKNYGAYQLRKTSSKRHVIAMGLVIALAGVAVLSASILKATGQLSEKGVAYDSTVTISTLEQKQDIPEELQVKEIEKVPEPPLLRKSIQFTPPVIKPNEEVTSEVVTQDQLTKEVDAIIATATVDGSSTAGISIDDLKDNKVVVQADPKEKEIVHDFVEQMPEYPGGQTELMKYLNQNIKYPVIAQETGIEGRVTVRFVVGKDGTVSDVRVVRSLDPSCDKEAVRVVKSLSKWTPGRQNGRAVAVYYTVPVTFKLAK